MNKKIIILGAGPTGLGAAIRLQQLGHTNWKIIDQNEYTGGLATSITDPNGFIWDIGGHVIFSHYNYFSDLIDKGLLTYAERTKCLGENEPVRVEKLWCVHKRESWIRFSTDGWIPYPFQNSFYMLSERKIVRDCFDGLFEIYRNSMIKQTRNEANFHDLIINKFGKGLGDHFMFPYNFKVWGYPAAEMNASWTGERVAMVDLEKTHRDFINYSLSSGIEKQAELVDKNWGPNSTFKYPKYGGNASIWKGVGFMLDEKNLKLNTKIVEVDGEKREVKLAGDKTESYDYLISTIPLDLLLSSLLKANNKINAEAVFSKLGRPRFSKTHVIGLGFDGETPEELKAKSWAYFPSLERSPFYRMTVFSNYSPFNVPKPGEQWSMMFEVCESPFLPRNSDTMIEETIQGALNEGLVRPEHLDSIASKFHFGSDYGYPTPYLNRDKFLAEVEPVLRGELGVYSRGRFGGWKYEVSNQDHSCMQGVEAVDCILFGCEEQTFFHANHVNGRKDTSRRLF